LGVSVESRERGVIFSAASVSRMAPHASIPNIAQLRSIDHNTRTPGALEGAAKHPCVPFYGDMSQQTFAVVVVPGNAPTLQKSREPFPVVEQVGEGTQHDGAWRHGEDFTTSSTPSYSDA
jgi:hypothetical protein